jgi:hypothetical protein
MIADVSKIEVQIGELHYKVHTGELYFVSDRLTTDGTTEYLITTGAKKAHIRILVKTGGKVSIDYIGPVTPSVNGSAITAQQWNRGYANTAVTAFFRGPTYTGGTVILVSQSGFGSNPGSAQSGIDSNDEEAILPPNTSFVVKLVPAASTDIIVRFEFYETN